MHDLFLLIPSMAPEVLQRPEYSVTVRMICSFLKVSLLFQWLMGWRMDYWSLTYFVNFKLHSLCCIFYGRRKYQPPCGCVLSYYQDGHENWLSFRLMYILSWRICTLQYGCNISPKACPTSPIPQMRSRAYVLLAFIFSTSLYDENGAAYNGIYLNRFSELDTKHLSHFRINLETLSCKVILEIGKGMEMTGNGIGCIRRTVGNLSS